MKTNLLFALAFVLGAIAIVWMGAGFIGADALALAVTIVIGFVYLLGSVELLQFRLATATLTRAINALPTEQQSNPNTLQNWLAKLHPSLQNATRTRIEGERVGLPAPIFTPYLVGLLIMLGLLGTFVGMVDTLQGAVAALQGSTELEAIRAGLAAPIQGLGLAFGTSVAGVAASAMLGLNSTLSRRERMLATRHLDGIINNEFREYSHSYNQQQTFQAIQDQARALPEAAEKLNQMANALERMGNTLNEQLLNNQSQFQDSAQKHYQALAQSVGDSLQQTLGESSRLAVQSIKPIVVETMAKLGSEANNTHTAMSATTKNQLEAITELLQGNTQTITTALDSSLAQFSGRFENVSADMLQSFDAASTQWIANHGSAQEATATGLLDEIGKLLSASETLVEARAANESTWLGQQDERLQQLTSNLSEHLSALRTEEEQRGQAALVRLEQLETTAAQHIKALGNELEQPMVRLIETASETPRAAAEVIGKLREEISNNVARDNQLLEERQAIMQDLAKVSDSLQQASSGQREAIDALVNSSGTMLQEVSSQFTDHLAGQASKISELTAHVAGGAVEMASLGDGFGLAIELFNESNQGLIDNLSRIEESMDKSTTRSDEQMSYYVAQAREIIDQSMLSQREVIDELRQLGQNGELFPAEAS